MLDRFREHRSIKWITSSTISIVCSCGVVGTFAQWSIKSFSSFCFAAHSTTNTRAAREKTNSLETQVSLVLVFDYCCWCWCGLVFELLVMGVLGKEELRLKKGALVGCLLWWLWWFHPPQKWKGCGRCDMDWDWADALLFLEKEEEASSWSFVGGQEASVVESCCAASLESDDERDCCDLNSLLVVSSKILLSDEELAKLTVEDDDDDDDDTVIDVVDAPDLSAFSWCEWFFWTGASTRMMLLDGCCCCCCCCFLAFIMPWIKLPTSLGNSWPALWAAFSWFLDMVSAMIWIFSFKSGWIKKSFMPRTNMALMADCTQSCWRIEANKAAWNWTSQRNRREQQQSNMCRGNVKTVLIFMIEGYQWIVGLERNGLKCSFDRRFINDKRSVDW